MKMEYRIIETNAGPIAHGQANQAIATTSDFLDVLFSSPSPTLALPKDSLIEDFFILKTGIAGEWLQKVVNYQRRLLILGDFSQVQSKSLRDFIYESNNTGKVVFADRIETGAELLK